MFLTGTSILTRPDGVEDDGRCRSRPTTVRVYLDDAAGKSMTGFNKESEGRERRGKEKTRKKKGGEGERGFEDHEHKEQGLVLFWGNMAASLRLCLYF